MNRILVFLWLLFIPTQLGKHFWPIWSHVLGLRVDYLSPVLYFGDLLWLLMVIKLRITNYELRIVKIFNFKNVLVLIFVLVNILVAENRWEAGYRWIRIVQWVLTFKLILENKPVFKEMLFKVLPFWIIGEGLLAVAQAVNGGSLNGIFYWLGERRFSYMSLGVAQISWLGEAQIRAYGTFSHPNSLAGFMVISLALWTGIKNKNWFYWMVFFCCLVGIFLAGSRTVWIIVVLLSVMGIKKFDWKQKMGTLMILGGLAILGLSLISNSYRLSDFVGGWDSDGLSKRGGLMVASLKMIKDSPVFGVGANNFLVKLPEYQQKSGVFWLQPVHNIIFLVVTEFGFIGLIAIFLFFRKIKIRKNLIVVGIILVTGMVDHYWLTLPQNWWLMCVVIGVL